MDKIIEEITAKTDLAKITLTNVPDRPGVASEIFTLLGEAGFNIETITQTSSRKNYCDVAFTIKENEIEKVLEYLLKNLQGFKITDAIIDQNIALITIYGQKLATTPGIAGKIFAIVAQKGVNIENISASLNMISFIINKDRCDEVIDAIKQNFQS
ncbi:MAG: ACT domain-containing protein [candidate division WOR-3 bacterium]